MNNDEKKTTGKTLRQILLSAQGISQEKIRASLKTRPDADCLMAMAAFIKPGLMERKAMLGFMAMIDKYRDSNRVLDITEPPLIKLTKDRPDFPYFLEMHALTVEYFVRMFNERDPLPERRDSRN
jgi:hypothetical protein